MTKFGIDIAHGINIALKKYLADFFQFVDESQPPDHFSKSNKPSPKFTPNASVLQP